MIDKKEIFPIGMGTWKINYQNNDDKKALNVCINALEEKNIIIETTGYSRNQVFAFQKYINLFLK